MQFIGELAGFSVACLRAVSGIQFSDAGLRIGSFYVNKIRLAVAALMFVLVMPIMTGGILPTGVNGDQWLWLTMSSLVGLVFGDACGFKALVMIGPRLSTLVRTSTPIMTTIIAWFFLGEQLRWHDMLGIAITVFGIAWVVSERNTKAPYEALHDLHPDTGTLFKGVLLALGSSFGQAAGLVLAKHAMTNFGAPTDPFVAAYIRILIATLVIWMYSLSQGTAKPAIIAVHNDRGTLWLIVFGAISSTFLGIWMSLVAVRHIEAGIAETLGSMTPIVILPLLWKFKKEPISLRAVVGTVIAVGGVAAIFHIP
jgi:drug/metabolite transporter (DMT)-like permease